ncbi:MAG: hypothetical protein ACOYZ8_02775 [Chloroflexota bacterium]
MGNRKLKRRIARIEERISRAWKGLLSLVVSLVLIVVGTTVDKYFGSPVLRSIEQFWATHGAVMLASFVVRITAYPVETSAVILLMTMAILLVLAYYETRDPKGIRVDREILRLVSGTYVDTGFSIINNAGTDLENCNLYISGINGQVVNRRFENDYLEWGSSFSRPSYKHITLHDGERGEVYVNQITGALKAAIKDMSKFAGIHSIELYFHCNLRDGGTETIIIYCTAQADIEESNGSQRYSLNLLKVGT